MRTRGESGPVAKAGTRAIGGGDDIMGDIAGSSPSSYFREAQALYSGFDSKMGEASFDMRSAWCGWLSFGFSGTVGISDATGSHEAGVVVYEGQVPVATSCSAAYCSSVLRDLCTDLAKAVRSDDGFGTPVTIFCDAEERGEYVVTVTPGEVTIQDALDDDKVLCSVMRDDGGSYLQDLADCLCDLYARIRALPDGQREDMLESLCSFCELVTEANGEISVEDAGNDDVVASFEGLRASLGAAWNHR